MKKDLNNFNTETTETTEAIEATETTETTEATEATGATGASNQTAPYIVAALYRSVAGHRTCLGTVEGLLDPSPYKIMESIFAFEGKLGIALASSFIDRRREIRHACFHDVMVRFNELCDDPERMGDFRLWAIDGSTVPLPRNTNSKNHYKSDNNTTGYNNIHCNLLLDILNQTFVDCYTGEGDSRRSHDEQGALYSLIYKRKINQPTILILD